MKKFASKKIILGLAAVAGLALSGSAFAAAAPMTQPTFTGILGGIDLGFRSVNYSLRHEMDFIGTDNFKHDSTDTQATEGVHIGYGYQFSNNLYLGATAQASIAQGKDSFTRTTPGFFATRSFTHELEFKELYGLNANLGYAVTPRFLPYLTAGWQWMKVDDKASETFAGVFRDTISMDKFTNGPDIGLGMHYRITQNVLIGGQFTAAFFKSISKDGTYFGSYNKIKVQASPVLTGTVSVDYLFNV